MTLAVYIRTEHLMQEAARASIQSMLHWLASCGLTPDHLLVDCCPAASWDRPELEELLRLCASGRVGRVAVDSLSSFSACVPELAALCGLLDRWGVALLCQGAPVLPGGGGAVRRAVLVAARKPWAFHHREPDRDFRRFLAAARLATPVAGGGQPVPLRLWPAAPEGSAPRFPGT